MLVREQRGPECERVRWIEGGKEAFASKLMAKCVEYKQTGCLEGVNCADVQVKSGKRNSALEETDQEKDYRFSSRIATR